MQKEHSKQLCEEVIKKNKSGDGYGTIFESPGVPLRTAKSIICNLKILTFFLARQWSLTESMLVASLLLRDN